MTEEDGDRYWDEVADWLKFIEDLAGPARRPDWLPHELEWATSSYWLAAAEREMQTRKTLSDQIKALAERREQPSESGFDATSRWLLERRLDWARLLLMQMRDLDRLAISPRDAAIEALTTSWEQDGCVSLWKVLEAIDDAPLRRDKEP